MSTRYVVDEKGERVAVLMDVEVYERMMEELEELEDIRDAEEARREIKNGEDEFILLDQAVREIREGKVLSD